MKIGDVVRIKCEACWDSSDVRLETGETLIGLITAVNRRTWHMESPLYVVMTSLGEYDLWLEEIEEVLNEDR